MLTAFFYYKFNVNNMNNNEHFCLAKPKNHFTVSTQYLLSQICQDTFFARLRQAGEGAYLLCGLVPRQNSASTYSMCVEKYPVLWIFT